MLIKQTYKNHIYSVKDVLFFFLLVVIFNIYLHIDNSPTDLWNYFEIILLTVLVLILAPTFTIYLRYLLYENDAYYELCADEIIIHKKDITESLKISDIDEIVFNGSTYIFEKFEPYRKFPWSDFYFLEIGLKNGEWIAITNLANKNLLDIFREKYPSKTYKINHIFYPLMTMY